MPTYYLRPGTTLADGKLFVRGAIPQITQRPRIEYGAVLVPGVEVTITRAQWEDGYAPVETLTLDGVDVIGDTTDNMDGTWAYTASTVGRLRYAAYPDNGAAYAGRVVVIAEYIDTPADMTSPDAEPEPGSAITITKGRTAGVPVDGVLTLDGVDVTDDATDTGPTLVYVVPAGGSAERTLTWTPNSGAAVSMTVYHAPVPIPPENVTPPSITWNGNNWTVTPGTWSGADTVNTVVTLDGVAVGLTGTITASDDGKTLLVTETATNEDGSTTVTVSDVVTYIAPPVNTSLTLTGSPTVSFFSRAGTDYTQIIWRSAGSFAISGTTLNGAQYALAGGGGSGGTDSLRGGGGGGAGGLVQASANLLVGNYSITVGSGGAGVGANVRGNAGNASSALKDGSAWLSAPGGGYGGGRNTYPGGNGACGGGASCVSTAYPGGTGSVGGNGGGADDSRGQGGGGGGGMGGNGGDNISGASGGAGGPGITLSWTQSSMTCCGGGGGGADTGGTPGTASHGGTPGTLGSGSLDATNGGGSGGCGNAGGSGNGGDGFFAMVFPTANAVIV